MIELFIKKPTDKNLDNWGNLFQDHSDIVLSKDILNTAYYMACMELKARFNSVDGIECLFDDELDSLPTDLVSLFLDAVSIYCVQMRTPKNGCTKGYKQMYNDRVYDYNLTNILK